MTSGGTGPDVGAVGAIYPESRKTNQPVAVDKHIRRLDILMDEAASGLGERCAKPLRSAMSASVQVTVLDDEGLDQRLATEVFEDEHGLPITSLAPASAAHEE
jgi:hypothetical protein